MDFSCLVVVVVQPVDLVGVDRECLTCSEDTRLRFSSEDGAGIQITKLQSLRRMLSGGRACAFLEKDANILHDVREFTLGLG